MFGSHLSIAGGMTNALDAAVALELDCVQVFTKNQRQWSAKPLAEADCDAWLAQLDAIGWRTTAGSAPRTVSHNSYLINLASPDPATREKSLALQRIELERCEALDIPLLVAHPGAHLGGTRLPKEPNTLDGSMRADEIAGLDRIVAALDQLHRELPGYRVLTCLETTVGSGTNLGYDFHHLAYLRDRVAEPARVGFCLDTCHVTAAGYDMTSDAKAAAVLEAFDAICGLDHLHVMHINDSIGAVGSRKDRHAHIGEGTCGDSCFRAVVNHPRLRDVPKILETPKEDAADGRPMDRINVERLKSLMSGVIPVDGTGQVPARSARSAGTKRSRARA